MRPEAALLLGLLIGCVGLTWAGEEDDYEDYVADDADEVDMDFSDYEGLDIDIDFKQFIGLRAGQKKGTCKRSGPKPTEKLFEKYTKNYKNNKCPCWYDLTKENCACCKEGVDAMQCGWPMQKYCYKKAAEGKTQMGCPGVCNNKFTLSGKGFPCYSNPTDTRCAWCTKNGYQCAQDAKNGPDSKFGSRCQAGNNQKYCKSVQGDCRHISGACPADRCIKTEQVSKFLNYYECQCPEDYPIGNGIQCYDADGNLMPAGDVVVDLQMSLVQEIETFPFDGSEIETGAELQHLIEEMEGVDCSSGSCSASFTETITEN